MSKSILLDKATLEPCPTRGELMCTIDDDDHLHVFSHMVESTETTPEKVERCACGHDRLRHLRDEESGCYVCAECTGYQPNPEPTDLDAARLWLHDYEVGEVNGGPTLGEDERLATFAAHVLESKRTEIRAEAVKEFLEKVDSQLKLVPWEPGQPYIFESAFSTMKQVAKEMEEGL